MAEYSISPHAEPGGSAEAPVWLSVCLLCAHSGAFVSYQNVCQFSS